MLPLALLVALGALTTATRVSASLARAAWQAETFVQVVDPDGRSIAGAEVSVAVEGRQSGGERRVLELEREPHVSQVDARLRGQPVLRTDRQGRACFLWPRGRALLLAGRRGEQWGCAWFPRDWRENPRPARMPGEPLRLELRPDFDVTVLVVDEAGRRCDDANVSLGSGSDPRLPGRRTPEGLVFPHAGFQSWSSSHPLIARLDGWPLDPAQQISLEPRRSPPGPIVLRRPPSGDVLVRVLDAQGRPCAEGGHVDLRHAEDPLPEAERRSDRKPPRVGGWTKEGNARFASVPLGARLVASAKGPGAHGEARFAGPVAAGESATVEVRLQPVPNEMDEVAPEQLVLSEGVRRDGEVGGQVRLDPGVSTRSVQLRLTSETTWTTGQPWVAAQQGAGSFHFTRVPNGPASLTALVANEPVQEFTLDVQPGKTRDPRLEAIDLRGRIAQHRVRMTGFDPALPFHARLFFEPARQRTRRIHQVHAYEPSAVIVSPWPALDVEVFAPGYRRAVLNDLRGDATVALEPGLRVRLRLVLDGELPRPPRHLKAALVYADRPERGIDWESPAFGPTREIVVHAWGPGRMQVLWILAERGEGPDEDREGRFGLEVSPPREIEVLDVATEQVFELHLSAEELDLALQSL